MSEAPQELSFSAAQINAVLERARTRMDPEDVRVLEAVCRFTLSAHVLLEQKTLSVARLRRALFGARTEKTQAVCPSAGAPAGSPPIKPPRKGHGRRPASAHTGARRVDVPHPNLQAGSLCPDCMQGKLRPLPPTVILRIQAQAPIISTCFALEKWRCLRCGVTHSAPTPAEAGTQKYAPNVGPMVGLFRFGTGVPHYRVERLQHMLGIPFPASTQWELMAATAESARSVLEYLILQAAQRDLFHNDDTTMRVQELRRAIKADPDASRTGIFTTCVLALSTTGKQPAIALYFTGNRHAGENLARVLDQRPEDLPIPMQMCDALSRNPPKPHPTQEANCLAHARREVVEALGNFPEEGRHILETLQIAYRVDAQARDQKLDAPERLQLHRLHTAPVMEALHPWLGQQLEQRRVEPNSGMGGAIRYLLNHWDKLTLFLHEPGAPLDNNICERALKHVVLHRKNSMSYKTERGAGVGDLFMSLIHTCRLNEVNPFLYLTALVSNAPAVQANPADWLPWNYPPAPNTT